MKSDDAILHEIRDLLKEALKRLPPVQPPYLEDKEDVYQRKTYVFNRVKAKIRAAVKQREDYQSINMMAVKVCRLFDYLVEKCESFDPKVFDWSLVKLSPKQAVIAQRLTGSDL